MSYKGLKLQNYVNYDNIHKLATANKFIKGGFLEYGSNKRKQQRLYKNNNGKN